MFEFVYDAQTENTETAAEGNSGRRCPFAVLTLKWSGFCCPMVTESNSG